MTLDETTMIKAIARAALQQSGDTAKMRLMMQTMVSTCDVKAIPCLFAKFHMMIEIPYETMTAVYEAVLRGEIPSIKTSKEKEGVCG